jgi:hypothetical protein
MEYSISLISLVASAALCVAWHVAKYYLWRDELTAAERASFARTLAHAPDGRLAAALGKGALTQHQQRLIVLRAARGQRGPGA